MDGVHYAAPRTGRSPSSRHPFFLEAFAQLTPLRQSRTDLTARHAGSEHATMKSRHPEDLGFVHQQR